MQSRRSFLGSVIGFLVASKLDFIATSAKILVPKAKSIQLLDCDLKIALFEKTEGIWINAPGIQRIIKTGESSWKVVAADLHATTSLDFSHAGLVSEGPFRCEIFNTDVYLYNGDILRTDYNIYLPAQLDIKKCEKLEDALKIVNKLTNS